MKKNGNGNGATNAERWRVEFHLVAKKYGKLSYWQPVPHRLSKNGTSMEVEVKQMVKAENGYKFLVVTVNGHRRPTEFVIYLNWSLGASPHWGVVKAQGKHLKGF